jgi:hypothetical protein
MANDVNRLDDRVRDWIVRRREMLSMVARQKMREAMLQNFDGKMAIVAPNMNTATDAMTDLSVEMLLQGRAKDEGQSEPNLTPKAAVRGEARATTRAANRVAAAKAKDAALENRPEMMRFVGQLDHVRSGYNAALAQSARHGMRADAFGFTSAPTSAPTRTMGARTVPKKAKQVFNFDASEGGSRLAIAPDDGGRVRVPELRVGSIIYVLFSDSIVGGSGEPVYRWQEAVVKTRRPPLLSAGDSDVSAMAVQIMREGESERTAPLDAFMQAKRRLSVLSLGWYRDLSKTALAKIPGMSGGKLPNKCEYILSLGARADGKDFLWPFDRAEGRYFRKKCGSVTRQCSGQLCWIRVADAAPGNEYHVGRFPLHGRTEPAHARGTWLTAGTST